ncbi:MAG: hypothetical protein NWE93_05280 [Candidatus Bathyarchaeota archaeon]|nr:hypothetical protein [Candidatus Bathyarchaeota archaeon]
MSVEKRLGIIQDVILSTDPKNRYDLYITENRIAIVCLGKMSRNESDSYRSLSAIPAAFGMPAPSDGATQPKQDMAEIEAEINRMPLDDLLRLSKKSCYYTYDEIKELRLILGRRSVFWILSDECASKFIPSPEQSWVLLGLMVAAEPLKSKLAVAGKWSLLEKIFQRKP